MFVVGIFEVEQVGQGMKWRVRNTVTDIAHVTYGTEEEVRALLAEQTEAWKRRFASTRYGSYAYRPAKPGS